jgi:hypothetical protein
LRPPDVFFVERRRLADRLAVRAFEADAERFLPLVERLVGLRLVGLRDEEEDEGDARRFVLRAELLLPLLVRDLGSEGTFPPAARASESPIAIACLRLVTFLPERPDFSLPRFISCIARPTFRLAFGPYLRPREPLDAAIETSSCG